MVQEQRDGAQSVDGGETVAAMAESEVKGEESVLQNDENNAEQKIEETLDNAAIEEVKE